MLLNNMNITGNNGEIHFNKANGNTIKLGEFEINTKYNHVKIDLGNTSIEYEFRTSEQLKYCVGIPTHMYWFKSQYVDRYHGCYGRDDKWAIELFDEVTPFADEINELIRKFISVACDLASSGGYKESKAK